MTPRHRLPKPDIDGRLASFALLAMNVAGLTCVGTMVAESQHRGVPAAAAVPDAAPPEAHMAPAAACRCGSREDMPAPGQARS